MNELIQELVTKAGLTEEQARKAVQVMTEFVEGKIPPMMRPMVNKFLTKAKQDQGNDVMDDSGLF